MTMIVAVLIDSTPLMRYGRTLCVLDGLQPISFGGCHSISVTATDTMSESAMCCVAESAKAIGAYNVTLP